LADKSYGIEVSASRNFPKGMLKLLASMEFNEKLDFKTVKIDKTV